MDIDEIKKHIEVGAGFAEVARDYLPRYRGIVRRVYIRKFKIQTDYSTMSEINLGEGETTFYFHYDCFEDVIKSAVQFLERPVSKWTDYNRTWCEWNFPNDIEKEEIEKSCIRLFSDLRERILELPKNFRYMTICDIYANGVYWGKIDPEEPPVSLLSNRQIVNYLCSLEREHNNY